MCSSSSVDVGDGLHKDFPVKAGRQLKPSRAAERSPAREKVEGPFASSDTVPVLTDAAPYTPNRSIRPHKPCVLDTIMKPVVAAAISGSHLQAPGYELKTNQICLR